MAAGDGMTPPPVRRQSDGAARDGRQGGVGGSWIEVTMRQKYVYWERYRNQSTPAPHAMWTWDDGNYDSFTHTFSYSRMINIFQKRWAIVGLTPEAKADWVKNGQWDAIRYFRTRP